MRGLLKRSTALTEIPALASEALARLQVAAEAMDARRHDLETLQSSGPNGNRQAEREAALSEAKGKLAQLRHEARVGLQVPTEDIKAAEAEVAAAEREAEAARPDPVGAARAIEAGKGRLDAAQEQGSVTFREIAAPFAEHIERRLPELANELTGLLLLRAAMALGNLPNRDPVPVIRNRDGIDLMAGAEASAEVVATAELLGSFANSWRRAFDALMR